MKIAAIDLFYLALPEITDAADGTQDTFVVRVRTDEGLEGWGESDASPLVSLAAYVCPMSHGNIINLRESLLGERVDTAEDVRRLHARARRRAMDIQQVDHAQSAVDIALWDVVGKKLGQPVYRLLGYERTYPKLPYASVLFGDTPSATRELASRLRSEGHRAAKFGWGPLGKGSAAQDVALVRAAREGLGPEPQLMIDAGVVWGRDVETAYQRACAFAPFRPTWLEEPFLAEAVDEYAALKAKKPPVAIAAGEGCNTFRAAEDFIAHGRVDFVQIDVGRIGGITVTDRVCRLARERGVTFVNHTFKSHLQLAASLHVLGGVEEFRLLEYPEAPSPLARELTTRRIERGPDGLVRTPEGPGLGVDVNEETVRRYMRRVTITIDGKRVFSGGWGVNVSGKGA
ncbi:MAG: mandelate racemase/muconate lactonizing enzyme family protein [Chloroflexota bacterium]|nr:mandelate racemase/muconate lactonizing enzyme family protein [Chloroflexota bacterium]